jgi:cell division protein FtsL
MGMLNFDYSRKVKTKEEIKEEKIKELKYIINSNKEEMSDFKKEIKEITDPIRVNENVKKLRKAIDVRVDILSALKTKLNKLTRKEK